jgi:predicted RNA-binding protein with RPS1 domain
VWNDSDARGVPVGGPIGNAHEFGSVVGYLRGRETGLVHASGCWVEAGQVRKGIQVNLQVGSEVKWFLCSFTTR